MKEDGRNRNREVNIINPAFSAQLALIITRHNLSYQLRGPGTVREGLKGRSGLLK
jgi:hypothetical protein